MPKHTNAPTIRLDRIDDSDRQRQDLGDLSRLAESIQAVGLIHPIVLSDTPNNDTGLYTLIAGGRRLATFRALGIPEIPYNLRSTADEADLREAELEENLARKDMTWQEYCTGIARVHDLRQRRVHYNSSQWGVRQTGQLMGIDASYVSHCLRVATAIKQNNAEVAKADNLTEAIRILIGQRESEALKLLQTVEQLQPIKDKPNSLLIDLGTPTESGGVNQPDIAEQVVPFGPTQFNLSRTILHSDCLQWMRQNPMSVDHIVTDPPYGINMKNLETFVDIDRVEAEHDVDDNMDLLEEFFKQAYPTLKDNGFCITFCDMQHFEKMLDWSIAAGFKVQRWPLIWKKSHPCINNCAQFNTTKDFEVALLSRKGNATLLKPQGTSIFEANGAVERKMYRNPFAKPFVLWKWLYDMIALPGHTVYDPFMGEASGVCAAINCGLNVIGTELSETHYPAAVENVKKAYQLVTGGKATFE